MMNGVDVADVTRSFSEDDWHKLGDAGRRYVNAERARNRGSGNDDNRNVSDANTGCAGNNADNAGDDTATGSTNGKRVPRMGLGLGPIVVVDVADGTLVLLPLAFAVSTESA